MQASAIKQHITQDAIAGHQATIDKLLQSIGERMAHHGGDPIIDAQINQDMAAYRILLQELEEMKHEQTANNSL